MDYNDKEINSMILFLRLNRIAEIQYIDRQITREAVSNPFMDSPLEQDKETGDLTFFDYMSGSHITETQLIASALESGWKKDWNV